MIEGIPLPVTDDPIDAPYWEAAGRGELVVQRCAACGKRRFPPRPMCPHCQSFEHDWQRMSGEGRVWSFAVPHPPLLPAFAKVAPYNVIVVELADDSSIRMVGNLVKSADGAINEIDPAAIKIGTPVRLVFQREADDVTLARWVIA
ncbi:MAG: OB-fold domain-containing protein [Deltaproteobacteria bacterium]|nr:OB-fold domain-containing protein [Deltaproteobacteria bacterium]